MLWGLEESIAQLDLKSGNQSKVIRAEKLKRSLQQLACSNVL